MNLDKEYQGLFELIAWLKEFKAQQDAQQTHQPILTVVPEQAELPLVPAKKIRQHIDAKNFKQKYTILENCCINDLLRQGWCYSDIGEILGRSGEAIKSQYLKHIKVTL